MTANAKTAVLGGGCFWCLDAVFRDLDGVLEVESGYAGGAVPNPSYEAVCSGRTGHAEVVRIRFDPARLSYDDLLRVFFTIHDPTTKDRQGNDVGSQYRSHIFVTSTKQREVAEQVKQRVNERGDWKAPIVTEVTSAGPFTLAEDYHQDYLEKNPGGYTCHFVRDFPPISK